MRKHDVKIDKITRFLEEHFLTGALETPNLTLTAKRAPFSSRKTAANFERFSTRKRKRSLKSRCYLICSVRSGRLNTQTHWKWFFSKRFFLPVVKMSERKNVHGKDSLAKICDKKKRMGKAKKKKRVASRSEVRTILN